MLLLCYIFLVNVTHEDYKTKQHVNLFVVKGLKENFQNLIPCTSLLRNHRPIPSVRPSLLALSWWLSWWNGKLTCQLMKINIISFNREIYLKCFHLALTFICHFFHHAYTSPNFFSSIFFTFSTTFTLPSSWSNYWWDVRW